MGIPTTNCYRRYNKLITEAVEWNDEMDRKLEAAYHKRREEMWKGIAADLEIPWKAAEGRAWDLGKKKFVKK